MCCFAVEEVLFLSCEQMKCVWGSQMLILWPGVHTLSFQGTLWQVEKDCCVTAGCQCGVSEWPSGAGTVYIKGAYNRSRTAIPGMATGGPHLSVEPSFLRSSFCSLSSRWRTSSILYKWISAVGTDDSSQTSIMKKNKSNLGLCNTTVK